MANNIANDEDGTLVKSVTIYNLRKSDKRIGARDKKYYCIQCDSQVIYAHSGKEGCFRHLKSTPIEVKEECPLYSGLLGGCPADIALEIDNKKKELQAFLEANGISGYKLLVYYSEPALVRYINKHPEENFIMIGKKITNWERDNLANGYLQLQKKALAKYLSSNKKPIIQAFCGTKPDKIYRMKYHNEYFNDVRLHPFLLSTSDLKVKNFENTKTLMQQEDILETRPTIGRHNDRKIPFPTVQ